MSWWRWRELNPRPQILRLRLYMLIRVIGFSRALPDRKEREQRFRKVLAIWPRTCLLASLCLSYPRKTASNKQTLLRDWP